MRIIRLRLKKHAYNIIVGSNILNRLGREIKKLNLGELAYIITTVTVKKICALKIKKVLSDAGMKVRFKVVAESEKSKSLKTASAVIANLIRTVGKKRIFIAAVGGGVVGDLAGFVASVYKRGVPYIQIPTTLLAQVDSSIGGKTAVDLAEGKNLVGTFYQPSLVYSDIALLKTLDLRQLHSGMAEVIKYAVIKDYDLFVYLEKMLPQILLRRESCLEFIVTRCSLLKARIVELDEREEKGLRTILNFGHTLGHAIEVAGGYRRYNHGQAIGLGMLLAGDLSVRLKLLKEKTRERIEDMLKETGLPTTIQKVSLKKIIKAHYYDKKFCGAKNRFVLIEDIGKTKIVEDIPLELIRQVIKDRITG